MNLVKTPGADPIAELPIRDPMPAMGDFADTAALLATLDLVITSDTSIAHLAGALARPCWLLLSATADWRWLMHVDRTPWYPTMVLFRQSKCGDWRGVIERICDSLALLARRFDGRDTNNLG